MEEAPENGKEPSHSAHANELMYWCFILSSFSIGVLRQVIHM